MIRALGALVLLAGCAAPAPPPAPAAQDPAAQDSVTPVETSRGPGLLAKGDTRSRAAVTVLMYCGITPDTTLIDILMDLPAPRDPATGGWVFDLPPGCVPQRS